METELQGKKGSQTMYVDSMGRILEVVKRTEPEAGHDIYLTLTGSPDRCVSYSEQQLAGIITDKLVNRDLDDNDYKKAANIPIPVKDVYYQLINNNVLDLVAFSAPEASQTEKTSMRSTASRENRSSHRSGASSRMDPQERWQTCRKTCLPTCSISIRCFPTVGSYRQTKVDQESDTYNAWKNDSISLRDYLYDGIAESWITTKLKIESRYSDADSIYQTIVEYVMDDLQNDAAFTKKIFRYLVNNGTVSGKELCLPSMTRIFWLTTRMKSRCWRRAEMSTHSSLSETRSPISRSHLRSLPWTRVPASAVITDVNTGEVRALVTYPSYDNNKFSGTVDAEYYNKLNNDQSLPLFNNATQAQKAPGSTFKPIIAVAALEEGVIGLNDTVNCTGIYKEITPALRCWIYPGQHGPPRCGPRHPELLQRVLL